MSNVGQELLDVPFGEMVAEIATSIAEAQLKLDKMSIEITKLMGDEDAEAIYLPNIDVDANGNVVDGEPIKTSMLGAGFQPTFYQFTDTIIEIKMAISMKSVDTSSKTGVIPRLSKAYAAPVDAKYANRYSYHVEGSSLIRTKITPIPPNPVIQKIIEMKSEAMRLSLESKIREAEQKLDSINE